MWGRLQRMIRYQPTITKTSSKRPREKVTRKSRVSNCNNKSNNNDFLLIINYIIGAATSTTFKSSLSPPNPSSLPKLNSKNCSACGMYFNSEKLLEKHFAANHDFQCKFCDQKMDKDLYGDHLRQHLASQRKKNT